jgi:hypothetical protein
MMSVKRQKRKISGSDGGSSTIIESIPKDVFNEMIRVVSPKMELILEEDEEYEVGCFKSFRVRIRLKDYFSQDYYFGVERMVGNYLTFMFGDMGENYNGSPVYESILNIKIDSMKSFEDGIPGLVDFVDDQIVIECGNRGVNTFYIEKFDLKSLKKFKNTWKESILELIEEKV